MTAHGASVVDAASAPVAGADEGAIGQRGRAIRLLLMAAAGALLLYGTVAGSDDMFPFGPLHMYSNYYPPNGVITSTAVMAQTAAGHTVYVTERDTGLARGDIEGELKQFIQDPTRLGALAASYHQRFPNASPFVEVRLVEKRWQLHNREVVGQTTVTLSDWHAR